MRDSDAPAAILHFTVPHKPKREKMIRIAYIGCDYFVTIVRILYTQGILKPKNRFKTSIQTLIHMRDSDAPRRDYAF